MTADDYELQGWSWRGRHGVRAVKKRRPQKPREPMPLGPGVLRPRCCEVPMSWSQPLMNSGDRGYWRCVRCGRVQPYVSEFDKYIERCEAAAIANEPLEAVPLHAVTRAR